MSSPVVRRFLGKIDDVSCTDKCWVWVGACNHQGYGQFMWEGRVWKAHKASLLILRGIDPGALCVCHHCDNPSCVNPDHLFLGTRQDNKDDQLRKGRSLSGEAHPQAKLSNREARIIKKSTERTCDLARKYGVSETAVYRIRKGLSWRGV